MKVNFGKRGMSVSVELDEKDLTEAMDVQETMKTPGWKAIMAHCAVLREQLIEQGKATCGSKTKEQERWAEICWASISGFDTASNVAQMIVDRAREYLTENRVKEKEDDGTHAL